MMPRSHQSPIKALTCRIWIQRPRSASPPAPRSVKQSPGPSAPSQEVRSCGLGATKSQVHPLSSLFLFVLLESVKLNNQLDPAQLVCFRSQVASVRHIIGSIPRPLFHCHMFKYPSPSFSRCMQISTRFSIVVTSLSLFF